MKITRDIVNDLLPAYLSDEASADTRALIEELSAADPEIARLVESARREMRPEKSRTMTAHAAALPPNLERETVTRTRAALRARSWLLAGAVFFTLLPFTFMFADGRVSFFMMRDEPRSPIFWVIAGFCWLGYILQGRRLRVG